MHTQTIRVAAMSVASLWLAGCATPYVRPDDMSADRHRREAERESQVARDHVDSRIGQTSRAPATADATGKEYLYSVPIYTPLDGSLAGAELHRQHARDHARAADFLERFEAIECRDFPPSSRAACPLLGPVIKIDDIRGGISARFKAGTPVDAIVAHMRCHYAYARARAFETGASCPLYMRGIEFRRGVDPMAVDIVSDNAATAAHIRTRSRAEAVYVRNE